MALIHCPSCGAELAQQAAACPRCGYSVAVPPPPARSSTRTGVMVVLGLVAALGVVVVGMRIFAAVAVPRLVHGPRITAEGDALVDLQMLYALEQKHLQRSGGYTANLTDPQREDYLVGWEGPLGSGHTYSVSLAAGGGLCIEATPAERSGPSARALSVDAGARIYGSAGCRGEVVYDPAGQQLEDSAVESDSGLEPITRAEGAAPPEGSSTGSYRVNAGGVYIPRALRGPEPAAPDTKPQRFLDP